MVIMSDRQIRKRIDFFWTTHEITLFCRRTSNHPSQY
jgi:hypothetical protein